MRQWLGRQRGRRALARFAEAPLHEVAERVGQGGRAVRNVQWMLRDSLQSEREPATALDRTRRLLDHLQHDREAMAQALLVATSEARQHTPVPFDRHTLEWLDSDQMRG